MDDSQQHAAPLAKLMISWGIVGIPLLWGVSQTLEKAMLLFQQ